MHPDNFFGSSELYCYAVGNGAINSGHYGLNIPAKVEFPPIHSQCSSSSLYGSGIGETAEAKAIASLRLHKEAEKRRRERINLHLDRLRALLHCSSKTDKATLLANVVQRVRELKQQTSQVTDLDTLPSETDGFAVNANHELSDDGKLILNASLCCDDRADLFADLVDALHSLKLKILRAEMSTLGGRTRNVLIVRGEMDQCQGQECAEVLRDALKGVLERSKMASDRSRRRRRFHSPKIDG
ncbi:hypothetical protein Nepgr_020520 [Nepenthes gracilis]|uniref:BHLH domain-containing protein n=1 Tax=Nepenthes gracilis TaxID=150966 RepID=A0AAD3SXS4_NEPGR|nr:hypothetical protein Nepgr_020520 [Nepenthes gracilis]